MKLTAIILSIFAPLLCAAAPCSLSFKWIELGLDTTKVCYHMQCHEKDGLKVYGVDYVSKDTICHTLSEFHCNIANGCDTTIVNSFIALSVLDALDYLRIFTDKGIIELPLTNEGRLTREISQMKTDYQQQLEHKSSIALIAWIAACIAILAAGVIIYLSAHRNKLRKQRMNDLTKALNDGSHKAEQLRAMIDNLYVERMATINKLCDEYFARSVSEKTKATLYKEVEKEILSLRDSKNIEALEEAVNKYMDNILQKLHAEIPQLSSADSTFLTYIYAGFSPKAICIFTDIKIKNFYNRRSRLREKILETDAPSKQLFADKM